MANSEWNDMETASAARGFASLSEYVRHLHNEALKAGGEEPPKPEMSESPRSGMDTGMISGPAS